MRSFSCLWTLILLLELATIVIIFSIVSTTTMTSAFVAAQLNFTLSPHQTATLSLTVPSTASSNRVDALVYDADQSDEISKIGNSYFQAPRRLSYSRDSLTDEYKYDHDGSVQPDFVNCESPRHDVSICPPFVIHPNVPNPQNSYYVKLFSEQTVQFNLNVTVRDSILQLGQAVEGSVFCGSIDYYVIEVGPSDSNIVIEVKQIGDQCLEDAVKSPCPFGALYVSRNTCPTISQFDLRQSFSRLAIISMSMSSTLSEGRYVIGVAADIFSGQFKDVAERNEKRLIGLRERLCCTQPLQYQLIVKSVGGQYDLLWLTLGLVAFCVGCCVVLVLLSYHCYKHTEAVHRLPKGSLGNARDVFDGRRMSSVVQPYDNNFNQRVELQNFHLQSMVSHRNLDSLNQVETKVELAVSNAHPENVTIGDTGVENSINKVLGLEDEKNIHNEIANGNGRHENGNGHHANGNANENGHHENGHENGHHEDGHHENSEDDPEHLRVAYRSKISAYFAFLLDAQRISDYWFVLLIAGLFTAVSAWQYVSLQLNDDFRAMERCHFNLRCQRDISIFSDYQLRGFNHLLTNLPYNIFGVFLILYVWKYQRLREQMEKEDWLDSDPNLFYAIGLTIVFTGIFSAIYHTCPTLDTFQYDSLFFFFFAGVCFIALYRKRHGIFLTRPLAFFFLFAVIFMLNSWGVVLLVHNSYYIFWIIFAFVVVIYAVVSSLRLYYYKNTFTFIFKRLKSNLTGMKCKPTFKARFASIALCMVVNLLIIIWCAVSNVDSSLLFVSLSIMSVNLYFFFYLGMKLWVVKKVPEERPQYLFTGLFLFCLLGVGAAIYVFQDYVTEIRRPIHVSRELAKECLFGAFDMHDLWHVLSALLLLVYSLLLFHIDDGLRLRRAHVF